MRFCAAFLLGALFLADDRTGTEVDLGGLKSKVPASWKEQPPTSNMRLTQFVVPKAENDPNDAEVVVFYFGQGGAGDNKANVERQLAKFVPPAGKAIGDVSKVTELKVGTETATVVDVSGTYKFKFPPNAPNAKEELKAEYRLIYVILPTPKGPHYIQFVGPQRTIEKHKAGFDEWVKNFK